VRLRRLAKDNPNIPGPARVQYWATNEGTTPEQLRKEAEEMASALRHGHGTAPPSTTKTQPAALSVDELARELDVPSRRLRDWLREKFPRPTAERYATWQLTDQHVQAARDWRETSSRARNGTDAAYVLDLCDELLGESSIREHTFPWLRGDRDRRGKRHRLPVDAYYANNELVIEYRERQHDEPVPFFDKPGVETVSGVDRREQRRLYDQRRDEEIPTHDLTLIFVRPSDLDSTPAGRLRRNQAADLPVLRRILQDAPPAPD
jgi:hypothetical protein